MLTVVESIRSPRVLGGSERVARCNHGWRFRHAILASQPHGLPQADAADNRAEHDASGNV